MPNPFIRNITERPQRAIGKVCAVNLSRSSTVQRLSRPACTLMRSSLTTVILHQMLSSGFHTSKDLLPQKRCTRAPINEKSQISVYINMHTTEEIYITKKLLSSSYAHTCQSRMMRKSWQCVIQQCAIRQCVIQPLATLIEQRLGEWQSLQSVF